MSLEYKKNVGQTRDHGLHPPRPVSAVIMMIAKKMELLFKPPPRKKHLTEKSNLPYKPYSSRGGSRAILGWTPRIRGLPTWISPAFNG